MIEAGVVVLNSARLRQFQRQKFPPMVVFTTLRSPKRHPNRSYLKARPKHQKSLLGVLLMAKKRTVRLEPDNSPLASMQLLDRLVHIR